MLFLAAEYIYYCLFAYIYLCGVAIVRFTHADLTFLWSIAPSYNAFWRLSKTGVFVIGVGYILHLSDHGQAVSLRPGCAGWISK